jgi:hypothetical protein
MTTHLYDDYTITKLTSILYTPSQGYSYILSSHPVTPQVKVHNPTHIYPQKRPFHRAAITASVFHGRSSKSLITGGAVVLGFESQDQTHSFATTTIGPFPQAVVESPGLLLKSKP